MVIPLEGFEDKNKSIKMRHTPALNEKLQEQSIENLLQTFNDNFNDFKEPFEKLNSQNISINVVEEKIEHIISKTRFPTRQSEVVLHTVEDEQDKLGLKAPNDWLLYNSFNFQLNHNPDINMDYHKREKLDQDILSMLLN